MKTSTKTKKVALNRAINESQDFIYNYILRTDPDPDYDLQSYNLQSYDWDECHNNWHCIGFHISWNDWCKEHNLGHKALNLQNLFELYYELTDENIEPNYKIVALENANDILDLKPLYDDYAIFDPWDDWAGDYLGWLCQVMQSELNLDNDYADQLFTEYYIPALKEVADRNADTVIQAVKDYIGQFAEEIKKCALANNKEEKIKNKNIFIQKETFKNVRIKKSL